MLSDEALSIDMDGYRSSVSAGRIPCRVAAGYILVVTIDATTMTRSPIKPLDAVWLMMESANTPMHTGVLAIFRKPRKAPADYMSQLAAQFREHRKAVPPWNLRLSNAGGTAAFHQLVPVRQFETDYHFRHAALPSPGGERELGVMISMLHSSRLDRGRPLWELHLIEGLERNRFAVYVKVHKSMVDNINAVPLFLSMMSASARRRNMPPLWTQPLRRTLDDDGPDSSEVDIRKILAGAAGSLNSLGRAASGLLLDALRRREGGSFLTPAGIPRSTLNRHINSQRRFATQHIRQERIERVAEATGSTVNEILTWLCGSSLRRFFKEYNALPDESLMAAVPISLSQQSERLPGNAIAGVRVSLGTDIGDPMARLEAVKKSLKRVRMDFASLPEEAVTVYVMTRAIPIYASQAPVLGRLVPPLFNLVVSNTPGPGRPRYFNGSRLEAIYPLNPLMQYSALSIDCVSYAGTLNIGFTGARDTLPHLQRLAVYLGRALDELEELVENPGAAA